MAHQCLSCGHLFPEGSSAILQGCPQCKGTRFFYTKAALAESDRQAMAAKAQRDLREVVADILKSAPASPELRGKMAAGLSQLRPSDLRDLVKAASANPQPAQPAAQSAAVRDQVAPYVVHAAQAKADERRAAVAAQVAQANQQPTHPDTVNIRKPGQYDIDVAALLDHEPIVVHKDGAYHIHLASLFDSANKQ